MSEIKFKFLKDAPIGKEAKGFFDFYHKSVAPALRTIIESDTCVHTIGLFGRWGTGKSTIVKLLKEDGVTDANIVEFDCWKYEKDSLRRQLLLQIAKDLKLSQNEIDELEKDFYFSVSEKVSDKLKISKAQVKKLGIYLIGPVIIILLLSLQLYPNPIVQLKEFLTTSLSLTFAAALFIWQFIADELKKVIMISPVTATKNQMDSPELFEKSFTRIIKKARSKKKIVIVIDNLDRVDSKVATEVLATLKTFLEIKDGEIDGKTVIFLVPCDFDAVKKAAPSPELADEFLRKIFNVVVWTPEYIDADIRTFIHEQIEQTGNINKLLKDDDVILVIESAFANSPREIKQFINNLISSLVVAFNTEVKEIVENNVAYMAKVLVLMHKYPTAFQRLKKVWHAPEEIVSAYDGTEYDSSAIRNEFRDFMLKTSRITVNDAEPYIYLKKPVVSSKLKDAEAIRLSLIDGNETDSKKHMEAESSKPDVREFVVDILNKYQNQAEILKNIYKTQLAVFSELKITSKTYINIVGSLLDSKVWPYFQELPTETVFGFILSDTQLDKRVRANILQRYIGALSSTEEFKNFQKVEGLKTIIRNLIQHQALLSAEQKTNLAQAVEQLYSGREDVVSLFIDDKNRDQFVTRKTLEQIIQTSNIQNFANRKDVVFGFQKLISHHQLFPLIYQKFAELLSQYNSKTAGFGDEKEQYLQQVLRSLAEFQSDFEQVGTTERTEFIKLVIQTFNNVNPWDNRLTLINILQHLEDIAEAGQKKEIKSLLAQFLQNAGPTAIESMLNYWDQEYTHGLITDLLPQLHSRILTQADFTKVIYSFANDETRLAILKHLITNQPAKAVDFITSLAAKDYKRVEVMQAFLEKATSVAGQERGPIYNFVIDKISKNDEVAIKDLAAEQIKSLLSQDNEANAGVGYDFFTKAQFLSDEKKREIVKLALEFLRQPGKAITKQHQHAIGAISTFFDKLQNTPQKDYIYFLFGLLKDGQDTNVIQIAINNLLQIKPPYKDYQKDYKDLGAALASWGNESTKKIVINGLLQLKPNGRISADEKDFWSSIENLNNPES